MSELDTCVASSCMLQHLSDFSVIQRADLPSDHAPITVSVSRTRVDLDSLLVRAASLGDHAALYGNTTRSALIRKPIRFVNIDRQMFASNIAQVNIPDIEEDINVSTKMISDALYECAGRSECRVRANQADVNLGRWERILKDKDDARVWKAISWRGDYDTSMHDRGDQPSDEDFRAHFESMLNPPGLVTRPQEVSTDVYIPVLDDPIAPNKVEYQIKKMKYVCSNTNLVCSNTNTNLV